MPIIAVLRFPGSNCDDDTRYALHDVLGADARYVWHTDDDLGGADAVVVPGGFSYGDYLRSGALAATSPVMRAVREFARRGGPVLGICNGFQILTEAGLLPGALARNIRLDFVCDTVTVRVERSDTLFTGAYRRAQVLRLPIAHHEGRYEADAGTLERLEGDGRVVLRYVDARGERGANPNGSANDIAGIVDERGNVLGMMPHPERAVEDLLGSSDGRGILASLIAAAVAA
jgi:phosphoribosylformylglycinamidine synthase subunit PurQ / glutaminase